jgi:hypothetical protein
MTCPAIQGTQSVESSNKSPQASHETRKFCCTSQSMIIFLGCVIGMREVLIRKEINLLSMKLQAILRIFSVNGAWGADFSDSRSFDVDCTAQRHLILCSILIWKPLSLTM